MVPPVRQLVKRSHSVSPPERRNGTAILFCRGTYVAEHSAGPASVHAVRQGHTPRARRRPQLSPKSAAGTFLIHRQEGPRSLLSMYQCVAANFLMTEALTDGCRRSPPLYGPMAELN